METTIAPALPTSGASDVRGGQTKADSPAGVDQTDTFAQQAVLAANDPAKIAALLKDLVQKRMLDNYVRRLAIEEQIKALREEANGLDTQINADETTMATLDGKVPVTAKGGKAATSFLDVVMDRAMSLIPVVQSAAQTSPAVARMLTTADEKSGGVIAQLLALSTPQKA